MSATDPAKGWTPLIITVAFITTIDSVNHGRRATATVFGVRRFRKFQTMASC